MRRDSLHLITDSFSSALLSFSIQTRRNWVGQLERRILISLERYVCVSCLNIKLTRLVLVWVIMQRTVGWSKNWITKRKRSRWYKTSNLVKVPEQQLQSFKKNWMISRKIFRFGEYSQIHVRKRQRENLGAVVPPYSLNSTFARSGTFSSWGEQISGKQQEEIRTWMNHVKLLEEKKIKMVSITDDDLCRQQAFTLDIMNFWT